MNRSWMFCVAALVALTLADCAHAPADVAREDVDFGPVAIERGGLPVETTSPHDPIVEIERPGAGRVWIFPARPEGRGDLMVRVPVAPKVCAGRDTAGALLEDRMTGARSLFENLAWADARGAHVLVRAVCAGSFVVLVVPGTVVDRARYPSRLAPRDAPVVEVRPPSRRERQGAPRAPVPAHD